MSILCPQSLWALVLIAVSGRSPKAHCALHTVPSPFSSTLSLWDWVLRSGRLGASSLRLQLPHPGSEPQRRKRHKHWLNCSSVVHSLAWEKQQLR